MLTGKSGEPAVSFQPVGANPAMGCRLDMTIGKESVERSLVTVMKSGIGVEIGVVGFRSGLRAGKIDGIGQQPVGAGVFETSGVKGRCSWSRWR